MKFRFDSFQAHNVIVSVKMLNICSIVFVFVLLGHPVPTSKWTKNKANLPTDDNISMSQKPDMCKLQITKAKRSDAGEYEIELENSSGKISVPITIKVIGLSVCLYSLCFLKRI